MDRQTYLKQFHKFQINREKHFAPKIYAALKHQYNQFLEAYKNSNKNALLNITSTGIHTVLKSLYKDSVHYASLIYSQLPKKIKRRAPIGFNEEFIKMINEYFNEDILQYSEAITNTTRETIQTALQIATEEGRNLQWIEDRLTTESIELNRTRSRLIARTETVTATNRASYFAAAKTGLLMKKEWLSASDKRVRPDHQMVNGSRIDMKDYFIVGDSKILLPGARIQENGLTTPAKEICNCRCVVQYLPQRNPKGALIEHDYELFHSLG